MDNKRRQRCIYVTAHQKKKLAELMSKHPELISCKVTQDFNYKDSQRLWQEIANECNSIPGARKTWKQWRKTWQDIRSKIKKKQAKTNREIPSSLTEAEHEALGLKPADYYQNQTEFVPLSYNNQENCNDEISASFSEPESPLELKEFELPNEKRKVKIKSGEKSSKHRNNCYFNCDIIALQEQRKIDMKESYWNFKKSYLKQKLKLLKEQTEALKSIAKELSN